MSLLKLDDAYNHGIQFFHALKTEMPDGKPICSPEDAGLLAQIICNVQKGEHLEIGTAYGGTLFVALRAMDYCGRKDKVVCIEPFGEDRRDTLHKAVEKEFWNNVRHFGVENRLELVKKSSRPFPLQKGRRFATAFIDGDHSSEYVLNDWNNLKDIVDRYIMFHDYVKKSVHKVVNTQVIQDPSWNLVAVHGWSAVMERR